jgi:hypothetical protein
MQNGVICLQVDFHLHKNLSYLLTFIVHFPTKTIKLFVQETIGKNNNELMGYCQLAYTRQPEYLGCERIDK